MTKRREYSHVGRLRLGIALLAAPIAWTLHLLLSYTTIAVGCAVGWQLAIRVTIIVITAAAAVGALASAWIVLRDWPRPLTFLEWTATDEEVAPPSAFLRGLGLIATFIFLLAILMGGAGSLLLPLCSPGAHH